MTDYINPIPSAAESETSVEVSENDQRTPKRITVKYQTTAIFEDIGEENKENTEKVVTG
jgi:hypothetical protein